MGYKGDAGSLDSGSHWALPTLGYLEGLDGGF